MCVGSAAMTELITRTDLEALIASGDVILVDAGAVTASSWKHGRSPMRPDLDQALWCERVRFLAPTRRETC